LAPAYPHPEVSGQYPAVLVGLTSLSGPGSYREGRNGKAYKSRKPFNISAEGFLLRFGTDLLSHPEVSGQYPAVLVGLTSLSGPDSYREGRNGKAYKPRKPFNISVKGFLLIFGTDLLSHVLPQYHRLWWA
jgi:hypothetical protein